MSARRWLPWVVGVVSACASTTRDASQGAVDAGAEVRDVSTDLGPGDVTRVDAGLADGALADAQLADAEVADGAPDDVGDGVRDVAIPSEGCWSGEITLDTGLEFEPYVDQVAGRDGHYALVSFGDSARLMVFDARFRRIAAPRSVPRSTRVIALEAGFLLSDPEGYQRLGFDGAPSAPRVEMALSGGFVARADGLYAMRRLDAATDGARVLVRLPLDGTGSALDTAVTIPAGAVLSAGPEGVLRLEPGDGGRALSFVDGDGTTRWSRPIVDPVDLGPTQWDATGRRWRVGAVNHIGPLYWDVAHAVWSVTDVGGMSAYGLGIDHGGVDFSFALGSEGRMIAVDSSFVSGRTTVSREPGGVLETLPGSWTGVRVLVDVPRARSVVTYSHHVSAGASPLVARCYAAP